MPNFTAPHYEAPEYDKAGDTFVYPDTGMHMADAIEVLNDWRLAHAYPLNIFQMTLRRPAREIDSHAVITQRQKRFSTIVDKLKAYPDIKLSEMQDIAGCRAIVSSVSEVYELANLYLSGYREHRFERKNDYIRGPKSDGYRGIHIIYRHHSPKAGAWDGLQVEMQFRTTLQHCWATAVEVVDIFLHEGLKRHHGSEIWRRFFALSGSYIAFQEGGRRVPRTPLTLEETKAELRPIATELLVVDRLGAFQQTLDVMDSESTKKEGIKWVTLALDQSGATPELNLYGFGSRQFQGAMAFTREQEGQANVDAVLVSVSGTADFRRAYPNYYLDTSGFLDIVKEAVS